jgi:hypothetical protein
MRCLILVLLAITGESRQLFPQSNDSLAGRMARPVFAMGQPPRWLPYASTFAVLSSGASGGGALLGLHRPVLNPITGLFGVSGEALGEWRAGGGAAGLRLLATVPALGLGLGADWRPTSGSVAALVTFQTAIRRGGLFGHGSLARIDWLPTHHTFDVGVQLPVMQPFAGRTRPRRTIAPGPPAVRSNQPPRAPALPPVDSSAHALDIVAEAATLISTYTSLYFEADESTLDAGARHPYGRSYDAATRAYQAALATAFGAAAGDSTQGQALASRARAEVLNDVILPYDALYGQAKADEDVDGLLDVAHAGFGRWLNDSAAVSASAQARILVVYDRWLDILDQLQRRLFGQWKDSRSVWLAPQLALAPEEYDEQAEVDALIGRAVGHSFTENNALAYLRTSDLPLEIARSIIAARKYHVLWTHDFTGRRLAGELDQIAYTMVADAYLPALTAAVQRYDTSGSIPQYIILFDAFYYHARDGGIWMSILENPLHASVRFRAGEEREAQHLRERLDTLRATVARSARLQREAATRGGASWLSQVVKVHVNVVLPSDFSFRSARIIPPIPFTSDNVSRDHRKLVLYDFTEADPYTGELLVTGIGIGEHYASATWEDRGYRLRGPAALEARAAVRRMLASNGFRQDQIPEPLRLATGARAVGSGADARRNVARVLHVHNEPGFGAKQSSVARAMLYSLAPPGSVIIVPDPLWLSANWAALLAGAAARGSNVMIIAPAKANAPSPEPPVIALERDVLRRLLAIRHHLAAQPNEGGGALRVGVYAAHAPATDVARRLAEVRVGMARAPWIRELIAFY